METTRPHKHVQIFFASHDHFPLIFYLKLLSISDLIVGDIDTQLILSMVQQYCGRVDFRIYSSLRVPLNP